MCLCVCVLFSHSQRFVSACRISVNGVCVVVCRRPRSTTSIFVYALRVYSLSIPDAKKWVNMSQNTRLWRQKRICHEHGFDHFSALIGIFHLLICIDGIICIMCTFIFLTDSNLEMGCTVVECQDITYVIYIFKEVHK